MKALSLLICAAVLMATALHAQTGNVGIGTTTPQAKLHTTGSVRHDTLAGTGSRLLYADADGRIFTPSVPPTNITDVIIPNNGCSGGLGAMSVINVAGMPAAVPSANIKVRLSVGHGAAGELRIFLRSPTGDTLRLITNVGGTGNNLSNTIFSDGAGSSIVAGTPPFTGSYKPQGGLTTDCGITPDVTTFGAMGSGGTIVPNGAWTLLLYDDGAANAGSLLEWSISFNGIDPFYLEQFTANVVPKGGNGSLVNGSIYDVAGNIGLGTAAPASKLHLRNANSDTTASQLIIEANSDFGPATTAAIEFRSNAGSTATGPSARIKSFYTSTSFTSAGITFQTVSPTSALVDAMTLTNAKMGIGTTTPDASAVMEVAATGKGMLVPRMTQPNRPVNPATGLLIYQTDNTPGFYYYDGAAWQMVGATKPTPSAFVTGTGPSTIYVSTAAAQYGFLGATNVIVITRTDQKIVVSASKAFGSTAAGGAANLNIAIGYQAVGGSGAIVPVGGSVLGLRCAQNTRHMESLSAIISGLAVGTYIVGMAGYTDAANSPLWNSNEYSYTTAHVIY